MTLGNLVERFEAHPHGQQYAARCPAHPDVRPSLHFLERDGKILLICRAGCRTERVLAAVGLTFQDLFTSTLDRSPRARPRVPRSRIRLSDVETELVAHERRAAMRRAPCQGAGELADELRKADQAVRDARRSVSEAGDTDDAWELAAAAADLAQRVELGDLELEAALAAAGRARRTGRW